MIAGTFVPQLNTYESAFFTLLSCLLLLFLIGCQDNLPDAVPLQAVTDDSTISVETARQIYTNFLQLKNSARVANSTQKDKFEKKLKWQYAQKEKFSNGTEVILVPLDSKVDNYPFGVMVRSDQATPKPTNIADIYTTRKAVIYRQKGKDQVEFLTIIGEQNYQKQVTFFNNDHEFTGAMLFHDDEGNFLRGFYYEKGKRTATLGEKQKDKNARRMEFEIIINYTINSCFYTVTVKGYGNV